MAMIFQVFTRCCDSSAGQLQVLSEMHPVHITAYKKIMGLISLLRCLGGEITVQGMKAAVVK